MDINEIEVPADAPPIREWMFAENSNRTSGMKYLLDKIVNCDVACAILKKKFVSREEHEEVLKRLSNLEKWTTIPNVNSKVYDNRADSTDSA